MPKLMLWLGVILTLYAIYKATPLVAMFFIVGWLAMSIGVNIDKD
jgi:hypothetical protein